MHRTIVRFALFAALFALAGCATVEGFGNDISGGARRVADWLGG